MTLKPQAPKKKTARSQKSEANGPVLRRTRAKQPEAGSQGDQQRPIDAAREVSSAGPAALVIEPVILIEIDSSISGGFVNGRFDVMIRGRAVSAAPIEEIRLQVGDWVTGAASFGQPGRAAAAVLSDGSPARQRAFQFNLPRPGDGDAEICEFQIIARTKDGFEYAEDFSIDIDPAAGDPVTVIAGPTRFGPGATRPHAVMYIERGTIDADGMLSVQGWAVALAPVIAIQVFAGEKRISIARIGGERQDVASVYPSYPNAGRSGFGLTLQMAEVDRSAERIRVQMVCPNGFGHEESIPVDHSPSASSLVAPAPAESEQPPAEIRMHCDVVELTGDGDLTVSGWAVCSAGIVQVRVLLDGEDVGLASFGYQRLDVGSTFPAIPAANLSGFKFAQHINGGFDGRYEVRVIVRNMLGDENDAQIAVVATEVVLPEPVALPADDQLDASRAPALTPREASEFRFEMDAPVVANGAAVALITGRLSVDGWLLSRTGIASFEVFLDDNRLGDAHYGLARQDVGAAFPEWPNALRSGYAFHCPPRSLLDGDHVVELRIRANDGQELVRAFRISVKKSDDGLDSSGIRRRVPRVEADMMTGFLVGADIRPSFQYILRQDRAIDIERLRVTLEALRLQAYANWTVRVLAKDEDIATTMRAIVQEIVPHLSSRFSVVGPSDAPLGPVEDGLLFGLLSPGDEPSADALLEFAVARVRHPGSDMLYGDEIRLSPVSNEKEPFFKPDFSPDLLFSTNYIGRLWVVTAELLAKTGVTSASLFEQGEYDLVLRCAELATGVHHIPKLLCQRGPAVLDSAEVEQSALERMLARRRIPGQVLPTAISGTWRVKRAVPSRAKVSIIIPTCAAQGYIETCITTLRAKTSYQDYEIICIDNIPPSGVAWKIWLQQNADKVVEIADAFNWSSFNNRAVDVADGDFLLFLNDDIEIIQDDWLDVLMEHARRPEVGVVGPQLLYRDGKVQHAGMFLSQNGIGRHAFRFAEADDPCYFGLALTQRNVMAVTGACMLVRREVFQQLGRFDEAHEIVNNDLDFCLRVHRAGLLTVFTPYATLTHYELASRANLKDVFDLSHFNAEWKTMFAAGDPYFSPRLSRHADDYRPDEEPVQSVFAGAPMFHPPEIQNILVVKLDHIGDFVTALRPIRRLKSFFPHARITVLAGPASRAFVALESCIDEFIPFSFFHARSQLGERDVSADDYAELDALLRPRRFDLAVDLRKHISTRDVLKHTGARFLAGFDYQGQFPFLDIALDWDGDRSLQRKRSHIVDDLMALVNAVGYASEPDRTIIQPGPASMPMAELPERVRALFAKQVVAVHPGAGNITKQWPEEHFSALIDLLVERNDVNILLVGGPDEVEVANSLLGNVQHPEAVASMAGETSLSELPRLLKNCVLYIGNDSGPKHIAAAVGIPTVGIHSGVVDPVEWGPIGPNAVALRRNMTCSPCYLARAEDCPRSLACLRLFEPNLVYETAALLLKPSGVSGLPSALTRMAEITEPPPMDDIPALEAADIDASRVADGIPLAADTLAAPTPSRKPKRRQRVKVPA